MAFIGAIGNLNDVMISNNDPYFLQSVVFALAALVIAVCRPYKKTYMNVVDILLLVHSILCFHLISSYQGFQIHSHFVYTFFVMISLPFAGFVSFFVYRCLRKVYKTKAFSAFSKRCKFCYRYFVMPRLCVNSQFMEQPLVQSASYSGSYGSIRNA